MLPNNYIVSAASSATIVTLAEARDHLNLFTDTTYDDYVSRLLRAGQDAAENYLGEFLSFTTVEAYWNRPDDRFTLPHRHVDSIASVTYYDSDDVLQTIPSTGYIHDTTGYRSSVRIRQASAIPAVSNLYENPIVINYNAVLNDQYITEAVAQAILLYVSGMFASRENYSLNQIAQPLPLASERLLAPLKRRLI